MPYSNILFNSTDIASLPGVSVNKVNYHTRGKRTVDRKILARANGSKVVNAQYESKQIIIQGVISATSKVLFETYRDTFFRYLEALESTLAVSQGGFTRNYTGTVDDVSWVEDPMGGFGEFVINFICSSPFSVASAFTTARNITGITVGSTTNGIGSISGSYKAQSKLTVTITSVTGGSGAYIKITNPATGKYIKVSRTWANSDILIVDITATDPVTVNGTAADFSGVFLELDPGAASITYEDSFTGRNVALKVEYKQRDL